MKNIFLSWGKKIKLKPLLPSLKEKKRYIVYEIISEKQFTPRDATAAIEKATKDFLGILGLSKAGIIILKERFKNNKGIIRVNNKYVDETKAALTLIKEINKTKVTFRSLGVSGILDKAQKKFIDKKEEK